MARSCYVDHKRLVSGRRRGTASESIVPIGKAMCAEGTHITITTHSYMIAVALDAGKNARIGWNRRRGR